MAHIAYENPLTVSQSGVKRNELYQSIAQSHKNRALIQLLRSWREGDEQEQRNTWEYLRQASPAWLMRKNGKISHKVKAKPITTSR